MSRAYYNVWRSGGPDYPSLMSRAARAVAEDFATRKSAADPERRTWVVENDDTLRAVAEYRNGRLRLDRPRDRRALRLAREKGEAA
jgi:hypothetical protein